MSPPGGDAATHFDLEITSPVAGAELHYTLNGEEPTRFHPSIASGGNISVRNNVTVKVKAWVGGDESATSSGDYRITGDVSAGVIHALALSGEGAAWSWGAQGSGRLGNLLSAPGNVATPTRVNYPGQSISNGSRVVAGKTHSLLLSSDRRVWAFGDNSDGALGDAGSLTRAYAAEVVVNDTTKPVLGDCVAIGAGQSFSTALSASGEVYAWGSRASGRLGDGLDTGNRRFAQRVQRGDVSGYPDLSGIAGLATGRGHSLAREKHALEAEAGTGRVWAWGQNEAGQLGRGDTASLTRAQLVMLNPTTVLTDAWDASAGERHSAVVRWKSDDPGLQGSVWSFGDKQHGRLGNNTPGSGNATYPVQVLRNDTLGALSGISSVACGSSHTLALDEDGKVWAWGYNGFGALGDGTTTDRGAAVRVQRSAGVDLEGIVRIGAGGEGNGSFSMAIDDKGKVFVWGRNANGQGGNGTATGGATVFPVEVPGFNLLALNPQVLLSATVNEPTPPGQVTITANPTHGAAYGSAMFERVDIFVNGQLKGACVAPNWTLSVSGLPEQFHHVYGIAHDLPGNRAMSPSLSIRIGSGQAKSFGLMSTGGPGDDPDGDGLTNAEEALLGTDPDSASFSGYPGSENYSYDALDRLIGVSGARVHSYGYDAAGNIQNAQ